jgi:DNA-binding SARP family transcriptional activator
MVMPVGEGLLRRPDAAERPVLHLLGGPYVVIGRRRLEIPEGSKRLLVFIALNGGRVERKQAAGTLWPLGDDTRAAGNLRSALWRLKGAGIRLIDSDKCALMLCSDTVVDVDVIVDWARRVIEGPPLAEDLYTPASWVDALDLLPGWYDEWVLFERERLRQRLLYALEALSRRLVEVSRCAEAVDAAMTAIRVEPLRESAQRALLEAHLGAGNIVEARRAYDSYRDLVHRELGVEPGASLAMLVAPPSDHHRSSDRGRQDSWAPGEVRHSRVRAVETVRV